MSYKPILSVFSRYLLLLILGLGDLFLFYAILTPLTVYASYIPLKIFFDATLYNYQSFINPGNVIFFKSLLANIIPACVAGSAYYFLLILNMTTPMNIRKRILSIIFLFSTFFIINVLRIVIFGVLLYRGYAYFDFTHKLTWYIGSTIMVVFIWFANVLIFKIKEVPVYSDMKSFFSQLNSGEAK